MKKMPYIFMFGCVLSYLLAAVLFFVSGSESLPFFGMGLVCHIGWHFAEKLEKIKTIRTIREIVRSKKTDPESIGDGAFPEKTALPSPQKRVAAHATETEPSVEADVCVKCGKKLPQNEPIPHMGQKKYCRTCYDSLKNRSDQNRKTKEAERLVTALAAARDQLIQKQKQEEIAVMRIKKRQEQLCHRKCSVCGCDRPQSALHPVNGEQLCEYCFRNRFPVALSIDALSHHDGIIRFCHDEICGKPFAGVT